MEIFSHPMVLLLVRYGFPLLCAIIAGFIIYVYRDFLKASWREFQHVVWPTRKETTHYFLLVLAMIVFFSIYLFIFSNIFSQFILWLNKTISL